MKIKSVDITNFRGLSKIETELEKPVSVIVGPNAIGKTSVLEALFLLGRGRSFRTRNSERLIRHGDESEND